MASRLDYVVSPSLLENHPVSPQFHVGMEEWADACLEFLERSLPASLAGEDDYFGHSHYPKSHPPTSARTLPLRPHPLLEWKLLYIAAYCTLLICIKRHNKPLGLCNITVSAIWHIFHLATT